MRTFIAIPLSDTSKTFIQDTVKSLQSSIKTKKVRWTKKDNYHITLSFLGKIKEEQLEAIKKACTEAARELSPFETHLHSLVFFPKQSKARIVAIEAHLCESLGKLYASIKSKMEELGFELDKRPFLPHVTIGRIKFGAPIELSEIMQFHFNFEVNEIALFESKNGVDGVEYEKVFSVDL